jgi:hypothetical protein
VLLRCPTFASDRLELVAAVRTTMPAAVVEWAGEMIAHPRRWLALLLDGRLTGVPLAEVYGRSVKAVRIFRRFRLDERYRMGCYRVFRARAALRRAARPILVRIQERLAEVAGYRV